MGPFSVSLNDETIKKLEEEYLPFSLTPPHEAMEFYAKNSDVAISVYSKKDKVGLRKVVFAGKKSEDLAKRYGFCAENQSQESKKILNGYPQIGSDEVGTGDFFGPICVVASFIEKKDLPRLKELGIQDSKKMDDSHILKIGPTLIKEFQYSSLSLSPEEYNEVHQSLNMNAIKAKMHDKALGNLAKKFPGSYIYMDQFAAEPLYYSYLKDVKDPVRGITFSTKGESVFPSVALSSVIARYAFLRKMKALGKKYGIDFPLGASDAVTEFAKEFAEKYSLEELKKVAKISFANYKKLTESI